MKRTTTALAAMALAFGLAACQSEPIPTPSPEPAPPTPGAVLSQDRLEEILAEVSSSLTAADAAASAAELGERFTGPALEMRTAEYALASLSSGANEVTPLVTDAQVSVVAATTEWPRVANVVTTIPEGTNLPLLLTFVQQGARENYALWSWVRLFPGVAMPATTQPAVGSAPVAPDASGLLMSPEAALGAYVDLLNNREESASSGSFAEEPFRANWGQTLDQLASAVEVAGTAAQVSEVSPEGSYSIATHDGGAIVVGAINQTLTVTRTVEGSTLNVGPSLAYGGESTVQGSLTATYLATVAFYIPPEGGDEQQVTVLGAEQVQIGVTRDDSVSPD
nr:hypothetical protein [Actinomycetales bacterium]